jgi:hypothetical protein
MTNLHVWLRVEATGVEAAHERAQVILEPALSALTFALSSSERVTGFRPGSDVWFSYGNAANGSGGWRGSRHRTEFADRKVSAKFLQDFSIAYAPLIERAAGLAVPRCSAPDTPTRRTRASLSFAAPAPHACHVQYSRGTSHSRRLRLSSVLSHSDSPRDDARSTHARKRQRDNLKTPSRAVRAFHACAGESEDPLYSSDENDFEGAESAIVHLHK